MEIKAYDVVIIGGSYAGLAAAMALGRSLRTVLVIDSGLPCNHQTPHSHNFITHDGATPAAIAAQAKAQVKAYNTVSFFDGLATHGRVIDNGFEIDTATGDKFTARKIIFATGVKDLMPDIDGFAACWGISAIHCPYCHGYEVKGEKTGIMANGEEAFEFTKLVYNLTKQITLFTNGPSNFTDQQHAQLKARNIDVIEQQVNAVKHAAGYINQVILADGTSIPLTALYAKLPFQQHSTLPEKLGCLLTPDGYLQAGLFADTPVYGIFACGDNVTRMRSVANAVAQGTTAGAMVNRQLAIEDF